MLSGIVHYVVPVITAKVVPSHTALFKTYVRSAFLIQISYPVIGVP